MQVSIDQITPASDNPRRSVGDVTELAMSIKSVGILQPLVVTQNGTGYVLVIGHRRLEAAKVAGLTEVPVEVKDLDDVARREIMLIENIQRDDLSPLEEAVAYKTLVDEHGFSQRQLSERIGRSQPHISKRIALLELPEPAREAVDSGGITLDDAMVLGKLPAKAVKEVLKDATHGRGDDKYIDRTSLEHMANRRVAEIEKEAKLKELYKELTKKGLKVIQRPNYGDRKVKTLGNRHGYLDLRKAKHQSEPCHAVFIEMSWSFTDPQVVAVCTDVSRHGKKGASELKGTVVGGTSTRTRAASEQKKKAARKEIETALTEAADRRRTFLKSTVFKRAIKKEDVVTLLVGDFVESDSEFFDPPTSIDVLEFLEDRKVDDDDIDTARAELGKAITADDGKTEARVALAIPILAIEGQLENVFNWSDERRSWACHLFYFGWLTSKGYEISEVEKEQLAIKVGR